MPMSLAGNLLSCWVMAQGRIRWVVWLLRKRVKPQKVHAEVHKMVREVAMKSKKPQQEERDGRRRSGAMGFPGGRAL